MVNLMKNQRGEKYTGIHTIKIMMFCIVLLMSIQLISSAEFDNIYSFDKNIGGYGKYEIKDWFGLIKLQDLELKSNTEVCSDDCRAEIPINHYQNGILIEDIRFIDAKTGNETMVRSYEFKVNGKNYNLGNKLDKGDYDLELLAEVKPFQVVDWQIKVQGKWLDEWAIFGSSLQDDLIVYYTFDETSGSNATDSMEFLNATGEGIGSDNWVPGILNNAVRFNGVDEYFNLSVADFQFGTGNFSISFWINITDGDNMAVYGTDATGGYIIQTRTTKLILFDGVGGTDELKSDNPNIYDNDWHHIVFISDGAGANDRIFIDGVSSLDTNLGNNNNMDTTTIARIGAAGNAGSIISFLNGSLDELAIANRSWTDDEVATLFGGGTPPDIGSPSPDIILGSPENGFTSINPIVEFTINASIFGEETISNASLFHNGSGSFIRVNETSGLTLKNEIINWTQILPIANFDWFVEVCDSGGLCSFSLTNRSISITNIIENSKTFNSSVLETSIQNFIINITIVNGFNIQNADLIYNGTINSGATFINTFGNDFDISKSITIDQGKQGFVSENRNFSFNITTVNSTSGETFNFVSSESTQIVNEISFGICAGDLNISMLNFTMVNEITGIELNATKNATTFQATFNIGINPDNLIKNFTVNNQSTNSSRFNFCTSASTNVFTIDMEAFFTAVGFNDRNYFLDEATLTNTTNEINLSLLPDSVGVEFFIDVEQDLFPLTNAIINIQKFFIGEGVSRTIEIDRTDNDGKITSFLELNKDHTFSITKDGELLAIIEKRAICEAAPCTILLSITSETTDIYEGFNEAFASNVLYNLSFNGGTKQVTFEFIDTTGLATSFRMDVIRSSSNSTAEIINSQTLFTSAGSMTFNASNLTGDFKVETFITRSPAQFIDFITFFISDIAQELGILGLFMAFLTILVIIFGISFTPRILVLAVPMALTTVKLMGLVSLSNTALTALYLLAGLAIAFMSR